MRSISQKQIDVFCDYIGLINSNTFRRSEEFRIEAYDYLMYKYPGITDNQTSFELIRLTFLYIIYCRGDSSMKEDFYDWLKIKCNEHSLEEDKYKREFEEACSVINDSI